MAVPVPIGKAQNSQQFQNSLQTAWPTQPPVPSKEEYANEVEVIDGEHDVTLAFYRKAQTGSTGERRVIKLITVPRSLWDGLTKKKR